MPVELHGGEPVDGLAAAFLADPVILARGVEIEMIEEFAQHVRRDAGISVPLSIGMPGRHAR